ncbi:methyltransferase family protein [Christiangramia gaetbulicola]|uniref:Methyltransferase family protein n=1 Tax=Christiangramia gaetbulicola TaxID=703340 RepID=A0A2T6ALF9_9FLAO|nr:class I SAM-dependent methyltransferase [Christiangramia gaetbulicola]PTX44617.1 methyltransferase family protein [Christiangramia gaetbulicola]
MEKKSNPGFIFNKYASNYQDKYMNLELYADTLDTFIDILKKDDAKILDAGCGPGNISKYLLDRCPRLKILGIDISENMIALARNNNPEAQFKIMDCRKIDGLSEIYDAVIAGFISSYLNQKELSDFIKNTAGLLKYEGSLYLSGMDAGGKDAGHEVSSSDGEDVLFTYYHSIDFLQQTLEKYHFKIQHQFYLKNPNNAEGINDLVIIANKI